MFSIARSFAGVLLLCELSFASGPTNLPPRLLVLHSYSPDSIAPTPFDEIMRPVLEKKLGQKVEVYAEYLELQRFPEEEHQRLLVRDLQTRYRNRNIDVVVPVGFAALEFVQRHIGEILSPATPVVFVAVEARRIQGMRFAPNITGVVHSDDWRGALREILRFQPDTQEVVLVGGAAPIDREYLEEQRRQFQPYQARVKFRYLTDLPLVDILAQVSKLPPKTVVIQSGFNWDSEGQILTDDGALKLIYKTANVPVYALVGRNLGEGFVGGPIPAFRERYLLGADVVYRVLKGEKPGNIPIQSAVSAHAMAFDWRQLRRWGIKESLLPPGSVISFREPSPWQQYKWLIAGVGLFCLTETALIVGLLFQRARRRRVENALLKSRNEVRDLAGKLIVAQEDERKRIARELHDDHSQHLAAVAIFVNSIRHDLSALIPKSYRRIEELQDRLGHLHDGIHRLSHELHPPALESAGLNTALRQHVSELKQLTGMAVDVKARLESEVISPDVSLCLFRIAQEALRNAVKHSGTQHAEVTIKRGVGGLELVVTDWGRGFDPSTVRQTGGLGLTSMEERVRLLGGTLHITSTPQKGTRISACVPCPRALPLSASVAASA
ncbi:MAG TPA: ATP-binding protein [Bryobacteraceae bacterium]|nr:ATP-binding protein [Bryobacteraceae bacterium]